MTGLFQAKIPVKLSSGKTEWQSHYFYFSKGSIKKGTVPKMLTGYQQVTVSGKTKAYYFYKGCCTEELKRQGFERLCRRRL